MFKVLTQKDDMGLILLATVDGEIVDSVLCTTKVEAQEALATMRANYKAGIYYV